MDELITSQTPHATPSSADAQDGWPLETNELGRRLNLHMLEDRDKYSGITLGAFRRGKSVNYISGALIRVWTKCARQEMVTGVPWPHALFMQTIGGPDGGHIMCPQCRVEVADLRARGLLGQPPRPVKQKAQLSLF